LAERSAVNRNVAGSSPAQGAISSSPIFSFPKAAASHCFLLYHKIIRLSRIDTKISPEVVVQAPPLFTPQEVAERCGLSRRRIYDWLAAGWLRGHRAGGRWLVTEADWDYFTRTCRTRRGRLMPSLRDWPPLWAAQPGSASGSSQPPPANKRG